MKAPSADLNQGFLLNGDLLDQINPKNPLMLLGQKIPWDFLESECKLPPNLGKRVSQPWKK